MGVVQIVKELVNRVEQEARQNCDICMGQVLIDFYPKLKDSLPKMESIP